MECRALVNLKIIANAMAYSSSDIFEGYGGHFSYWVEEFLAKKKYCGCNTFKSLLTKLARLIIHAAVNSGVKF
jgi:hypothetical protein